MSGSPRILTVDIETSPMLVYTFGLFKQNIGINQIKEHTRVLSWAAKWDDESRVRFMSDFHHGQQEMLQGVHDLLNEADIVNHFNGTTFDEPHLNREFKQAGLYLPAPYQRIDLYRAAKRSMYFPSYKLDYIAQQLGVGAKLTHEGMALWISCLNGDAKAWARFRRYNKQDVVITDDLRVEMGSYIPNHPNVALYREDGGADEERCPQCGEDNYHREGYAYLTAGKYPRFQCNDCGKWFRSKKAEAIVLTRGLS